MIQAVRRHHFYKVLAGGFPVSFCFLLLNPGLFPSIGEGMGRPFCEVQMKKIYLVPKGISWKSKIPMETVTIRRYSSLFSPISFANSKEKTTFQMMPTDLSSRHPVSSASKLGKCVQLEINKLPASSAVLFWELSL